MKQAIKELAIREELNGITNHGYNHSPHEAYAVLLEEIEEAEIELMNINEQSKLLWHEVKNSKGNIVSDLHVKEIARYAEGLAYEAVQVAAMARKFNKRGAENE